MAALAMWDTRICVQNREAVEKKCICGCCWKIVSVNRFTFLLG
ncbi:hypothetical protein T01_14825 [Trichinella spiralis]|uniref:Uncharacterized protein n=1 Tax=Trichinella spiralis TaxID=6334 RepID=A0A0V1AJ10_TRISP|nr:hypothetical protein T01_14825 [Trichinella spiralis]